MGRTCSRAPSGSCRLLVSERIVRGPRIGISRARERPLRFWLAGYLAVSPPRGAPVRGP